HGVSRQQRCIEAMCRGRETTEYTKKENRRVEKVTIACMCVCRAFRFRLFRVFRGDPPLGPTLEMAPTKPIVPGNKPSSTQHLNQKRGAVGAKTNPILTLPTEVLGS